MEENLGGIPVNCTVLQEWTVLIGALGRDQGSKSNEDSFRYTLFLCTGKLQYSTKSAQFMSMYRIFISSL